MHDDALSDPVETAPELEVPTGPPARAPSRREELQGLWAAHRRWVAAILLAHKPREADLDDLLQDVAVAVVSKSGQLRDPASIRPWLRTVALNAARLAHRRRSLRLASEPDPDARPDHRAAGPHDPPASSEQGERLLRLARELDPDYGEPLLLRCVQGMSYREIGAVMGLPETTIETRITRARRMIRDRCAELDQRRAGSGRAAPVHDRAPASTGGSAAGALGDCGRSGGAAPGAASRG